MESNKMSIFAMNGSKKDADRKNQKSIQIFFVYHVFHGDCSDRWEKSPRDLVYMIAWRWFIVRAVEIEVF